MSDTKKTYLDIARDLPIPLLLNAVDPWHTIAQHFAEMCSAMSARGARADRVSISSERDVSLQSIHIRIRSETPES